MSPEPSPEDPGPPGGAAASATPRIGLRPLAPRTLTDQAYLELRRAIAEIPIYDGDHDGHLDERALAAQLGISRTPVREALLRLESEGVVHTVPRRGVYVVRKTKEELIEVILASAALEGMAARLAAVRASDDELGALRSTFRRFSDPGISLDEYSALNVAFHQHIVDLARSDLFSQLVSRLRLHMRAVRRSTMGDSGRFERSVVDHDHIIDALEHRDADLVERLVRQHALDLAEHVRLHFSGGGE
jgi:DNA-binding GntR family transcriptional regulator